METSEILGCKEECCSNVSGWTMYLGSPANENDNDEEDDDDDHDTYEQGHTCQRENRHNHDDDDDDDDANNKSDDSMASDASSGPSHQELPWRSSKLSLDKHATSKYSWKQKLHKHKIKKDESRIKVERYEQTVLTAKDTTSQGQSGAKVRKSKQMDK